jgi:hypothetical protein
MIKARLRTHASLKSCAAAFPHGAAQGSTLYKDALVNHRSIKHQPLLDFEPGSEVSFGVLHELLGELDRHFQSLLKVIKVAKKSSIF